MARAPTSYDVIVIGLGGMGSAAAYHIAARGQRVLGLDRHQPAHDRGASHGGSRVIRQAYFEDPAYVPLLLRAYELWEKLAHDASAEVYRLTGGLFIGAQDCPLVAGSLRASRQWGLPHEVLNATEIVSRFPYFTPHPDDIALYEAKTGFARPEVTVRAHLRLAARSGAALHFGEPVHHWSSTTDGVRVTTAQGTYTAGQLVVCPGPWAPQLLGELGATITIERQVMYWLDPLVGSTVFENHPVFTNENASGTRIYGLPAIDGPNGGVKVAYHGKGNACTPETVDRVVHPEEISGMQQRVGELVPALAGPCLRAITCMYSMTADGHFVIAHHPQHANVSVACGFSGHGFKFVPVVGEILSDLTTSGSTSHPISLFDPQRFGGQTTTAPASTDALRFDGAGPS